MNITLNRRQFHGLCVGTAAFGGWSATAGKPSLGSQSLNRLDVWHTWRGPTANNIAAPGNQLPERIAPENVRWVTPVPGRGHSSPVVTDSQIFLTTADKVAGYQGVLAFDRQTGKVLWNEVLHRGGLPAENHPKNTEASSTVAFDGDRLFAIFYNSASLRLTALSPSGKVLWQENLGHYDPQRYQYGYAASPCIYQDTVIVVADYDGKAFLTARDRASGKLVWRVERPTNISFSSPIVAKTAGRDQLVLSGAGRVMSYDPASGKLLWEAAATTAATCGTIVWDEQHVFASGGYPKAETACVKSDGSGEVVWTNNQKCYEQSMLIHDGYLYAVTDAGVAQCWRATDGQSMWRQRLGGDYSSSPVLVGNTIYVFNEQGEGFVFAAEPDGYRELGRSKMADDVFATPSVCGNTMFLRYAKREGQTRQEYLTALA